MIISKTLEKLIILVLILIIGWCFYIFVRGFDPLTASFIQANLSIGIKHDAPVFFNHAPSFLHALAIYLLFQITFKHISSFILTWLFTSYGYEISQSLWPQLGTYDPGDMLAITFAGMIAYLVFGLNGARHSTTQPIALKLAIIAFASWTSFASGYYNPYSPPTHKPICMSEEDFRSSFRVEDPRSIENAGKVVSHADYLFVSDIFKGVHIFDNSNPEEPIPLAFLNIIGNSDLAIKGEYLYADSAMDLLTIYLSAEKIELVKRLENVFELQTASEITEEKISPSPLLMEQCKEEEKIVVGYEK